MNVDYCNVALAGLLQCDLDWLQTIVNATARRHTQVRSHQTAADRLASAASHRADSVQVVCADTSLSVWLRTEVPNRFDSNVATIESRHRLRSASTTQLIVPSTRRSTIGDCSFTVDAPRAWNNLPEMLRRLSSHLQFKELLKLTWQILTVKYSLVACASYSAIEIV